MTNWRYKDDWPLWETITAGRIEIDTVNTCIRHDGYYHFEFVRESCVVTYRTSLDGASNSQLGFFELNGGQT